MNLKSHKILYLSLAVIGIAWLWLLTADAEELRSGVTKVGFATEVAAPDNDNSVPIPNSEPKRNWPREPDGHLPPLPQPPPSLLDQNMPDIIDPRQSLFPFDEAEAERQKKELEDKFRVPNIEIVFPPTFPVPPEPEIPINPDTDPFPEVPKDPDLGTVFPPWPIKPVAPEEEVEPEPKDRDRDKKSADKDPFVIGEWDYIYYEAEKCSNGPQTDWDDDGYIEHMCAWFTPNTKILLNSKPGLEMITWKNFMGTFDYIWIDANSNMIPEENELKNLDRSPVIYNIMSWENGIFHPENGKAIYAIMGSDDFEEKIYSTHPPYWMKGI